jgi:hypothetical protein
MINFVSEKEQSSLVGYFLAVVLFFSSVAQTIILQHYFHRFVMIFNFIVSECFLFA